MPELNSVSEEDDARISGRCAFAINADIDQELLTRHTIIVPCPIVDLDKKGLVLDVEDWSSVRWLHFREGKSIRWIAKEFKISRKTVAKYLQKSEAPKYTLTQARARPVAERWHSRVAEIVESDKEAPRKQRHTARRIYTRLLQENGYDGSERTIRQLVADIKNKPSRKASVPLLFLPGKDAQVDFGESYADIAGKRVKLQMF